MPGLPGNPGGPGFPMAPCKQVHIMSDAVEMQHRCHVTLATLLPVILETLQYHQYRAVLEVLGVPLCPSPLLDRLDPEMRRKIIRRNKHMLLTHAVCCTSIHLQSLLVITIAILFFLRYGGSQALSSGHHLFNITNMHFCLSVTKSEIDI